MDRRSYRQFCGIAKSLDVVGERWTLLIVRNLLLGPLRYSDLLRGLPGITTNLLAKRLREMEEFDLVEHTRASAADGVQAYRLTTLGQKLEPVLHALGHWAWQWMDAPARDEQRNIEWLLVALRRRYVGGVTLRAELVVGDVRYRLVLARKRVEIGRGELPDADVRIRGTNEAMLRLFLEPVAKGRALPAGLTVDGPVAMVRALADAFLKSEIDSAA